MKYEIKRDTEVNWSKATNFIPKKGEIILYDCTNKPMIKVGDGVTKVNDLEFAEVTTIKLEGTQKVDGTKLIL